MAGNTDYKRKFTPEKYDRIEVTALKGKKDTIKAHADKQGESVNGFIHRAIVEAMERDSDSTGKVTLLVQK